MFDGGVSRFDCAEFSARLRTCSSPIQELVPVDDIMKQISRIIFFYSGAFPRVGNHRLTGDICAA